MSERPKKSGSGRSTVSPASAMKRRDAFVDEVAATIRSRHGKEGESFVFGLSGRWGEGKTHFLSQLRGSLEEAGFEVLDLNPWKYAADRTAFLRAFLVRLLETQPVGSRWAAAWSCLRRRRWGDAWDMFIFRRFMLARLRTDVSRQTISWFRLAILMALGAAAYWFVVDVLTQSQRDSFSFVKVPATFALFTIVVWVARGLIGTQASSKAATAVDEFDRLTSLALGNCDCTEGPTGQGGRQREIVVFVDDLDRVTSSVARDVLDNLRTFFDKPALSFLVTGDHVVLEANLGRELLPEDARPEQLEEGRLFLKKIFNVYWRLPAPVPSDFHAFVDAQMAERAPETAEVIPSPEDRALLREWLLHYTDRNLRQVIRTIDTFLFSLRLVRAQLVAVTDEERPVLEKMARSPMLLGRVLMIQDRCAPLFELLVSDATLLLDLDTRVTNAQVLGRDDSTQEVVRTFLDELSGGEHPRLGLTDRQERFLKRFAYERPRFYDNTMGGQVVTDLAPWIHLACDTSFGDSSGPRPEDFVRSLENGNREDLLASLKRCSETRSPAVADGTSAALCSVGDAAMRAQQLDMLLALLLEAERDSHLAARLVDSLLASIEGVLAGLSEQQRVTVLIAVLAAVDYQGHLKVLPEAAANAFVFRGPGDLQFLPREAYGPLGSAVALHWLTAYLGQNQVDCLRYLEELLPHLVLEGPDTDVAALGERVGNDLLPDGDASHRTQRLRLVVRHFPDGRPVVHGQVLAALERPDVWAWAVGVLEQDEFKAPWSRTELEDALIAWMAEAIDEGQLLQRLGYAVGRLEPRSDDLWRRIDDDCDVDLAGIPDHLLRDSALSSLPLPEGVATPLYEIRIDAVRIAAESGDEAQAVQLSQPMLSPSNWFWANVDRRRARKGLRYMAMPRAKNRRLQAVLRPFWEQWS